MQRHQPLQQKTKRVKKQKPVSNEDKAWGVYINDIRNNAAGDCIAPVELERNPVHYGNSTQYVEPNYTKDLNYQHGPLPNVPKSMRHWT
jgi:hypothetical protein